MTGSDDVRLTAWIEGRVQGVGFRWWVRARALECGLTGYAENLADGRVKVVAEGSQPACAELLALLAGTEPAPVADRSLPGRAVPPPRPGRVTRVVHRWAAVVGGFIGFAEK